MATGMIFPGMPICVAVVLHALYTMNLTWYSKALSMHACMSVSVCFISYQMRLHTSICMECLTAFLVPIIRPAYHAPKYYIGCYFCACLLEMRTEAAIDPEILFLSPDDATL